MPDLITTCPACGHWTGQAVGGVCTVFVRAADDADVPAEYCGCDCYKALTGRSLHDEIAEVPWGTRVETGDA